MKKYTLLLILTVFFCLIACTDTSESEVISDQEGIFPYELSDSDKNILQTFDMTQNARIVSFNAPKEAITFKVNIYTLNSDNTWDLNGGSGSSIGKERIPVDRLTGTFAMILKDNFAVDCFINCGGGSQFKVEEMQAKDNILASRVYFLDELKEIELNKEIPVALMLYNNENFMYTHSLDDYYDPDRLGYLEVVQVITMSFTENEL
jgi:hypothetical protein